MPRTDHVTSNRPHVCSVQEATVTRGFIATGSVADEHVPFTVAKAGTMNTTKRCLQLWIIIFIYYSIMITNPYKGLSPLHVPPLRYVVDEKF